MEKFYKGEIQRLFPILDAIKKGKTIQRCLFLGIVQEMESCRQ